MATVSATAGMSFPVRQGRDQPHFEVAKNQVYTPVHRRRWFRKPIYVHESGIVYALGDEVAAIIVKIFVI